MCTFVFKCLNRTGPSVFNKYFKRIDHVKAAIRNSIDLWIPNVRTKSAKRGIDYSGTKIFNTLLVHQLYAYFIHQLYEQFIISYTNILTQIASYHPVNQDSEQCTPPQLLS